MIIALHQLSVPQLWNRRRHQRRPPQLPARSSLLVTKCTLTKKGHRFLSSAAAADGDPSATKRLIRKFIASSPKSVALNALCHLLCPTSTYPHLSALALPLYCGITEASWFTYNAKLVAKVIVFLYKQERQSEAESLIFEAVSMLRTRERDLGLFYCSLVDSHSKHKSEKGLLDSCARLKQFLNGCSSLYVKRRAYESMINGLCLMALPREAEELVKEMRTSGFKPSVFEFRSVVQGYGRLGSFEDMNRKLDEMRNEGFEVDTICSNMILSSYGAHGNSSDMVLWLQKMKTSGVSFSIRTYNSVLNSCPAMVSTSQNPKSCPLSIEELMEILNGEEELLVQELVQSSVLDGLMEWNSLAVKLDLHGMHVSSAYLIMLQWMEELRCKFQAQNPLIPAEVTVVCGSGKHSIVRGESPVKYLVKEMMVRTMSPMRVDRKNTGCFISKGEAVRKWLC